MTIEVCCLCALGRSSDQCSVAMSYNPNVRGFHNLDLGGSEQRSSGQYRAPSGSGYQPGMYHLHVLITNTVPPPLPPLRPSASALGGSWLHGFWWLVLSTSDAAPARSTRPYTAATPATAINSRSGLPPARQLTCSCAHATDRIGLDLMCCDAVM